MNPRAILMQLAIAMRVCCSEQTIATLMNDLIGCEAEPRLADHQAHTAELFLDVLMDECPNARHLAQTGRTAS
jgi:hypothetical protein